jgi:hypothetical protein
VLLSVAGACASSAANPSPAPAGQEQAPAGRNRDLISQDELSADPGLRSLSVLEVVRTLRPHFLSERGVHKSESDPEAGKVHVSIDNGRIVPLSELNGIHAGAVIEIRYLSSAQAMQKFGGAAHQGPVIAVRTVL